MKVVAVTFVLACLSSGIAQQAAEFNVPSAYSVDRYEAGWNTNPFTLKTAAPAAEKVSSFKDLVLANMYQNGSESYVTLVNVKTRERVRLASNKTDPSGMRIKSANILARKSDSYAEIEKDGDTAVLRYDDKLLATLAAQGQIAQHQGTEGMHPAMADGGNPGAIPAALSGGNPMLRNRPATSAQPGQTQAPISQNSPGNGPPNSGIIPLPNRNAPPTRRRLLTAPPQGIPGQPPMGQPPSVPPPLSPP